MNKKRANVPHVALAAGAALTLLLAGCGGGSPDSAAPTTAPPPTTAEAVQTTAPPATTMAAPPSTTPRAAAPSDPRPLCKSADLRLSLGHGDAAAGTVYRPLRFTNTGSGACALQGFPGVSYVTGNDGHQVGPAAAREGSKGEVVTLQPGGVASATVGFVQVGNYDPAVCEPTDVRGLRVYPPQETASMYIAASGTGCARHELPGNQLTVSTIQSGPGEP
ncbi:DUF4232 domain-containing protein [Saccharomonospora sp. NPDC046836]|uniref:DUF4232 domain-containing protein n=1 Tax=Saccharomonospora sp. NPDC046836 TaxID=3156921 RepID=UPI0033D14095